MKWYVSGRVWTGPGRSFWLELGPFNTREEAVAAWGYAQGHPFYKQK